MLAARSPNALHVRSLIARVLLSTRAYSKDYASSSDDEKEPRRTTKSKSKKGPSEEKPASTMTQEEQKEESSTDRLNRILASMQTDSSTLEKKLSLAKPGETNRKNKEKAKQAAKEKDVFEAAKRVATMLGEENTKKTESELLSKLLGYKIDENIAPEDKVDKPKEKSTGKESELSLSELIVGMKIDRSQTSKASLDTRADYVRHMLGSKQRKPKDDIGKTRGRRPQRNYDRGAETYTGSVNLYGGEPMGIFKETDKLRPRNDILSTWEHLQQRELQMQVVRPPANYFEKMVLWTQQGKLWHFPIDNEQGISEDIANEDFSDHIFLEQHLESWCPNKGPIRHFMELVCVGLSKNPYITAKEKKEHILWYRDYFEAKKDILKDLISIEKMEQRTLSSEKAEV